MSEVIMEMQNMSGMVMDLLLNPSHGIKANDLKRIERAIHENSDIILNRWYEIFGDTENDEDNE